MTPTEAATALYADIRRVSERSARLVLRMWDQVDSDNVAASWGRLLPRATAVLIAAQTVAAETAEPYLGEVLPVAAAAAAAVSPDGLAGMADGELTVSDLLALLVPSTQDRVAAGLPPATALYQGRADLQLYVSTTTADAGRLATAAAVGARTQVEGYYRQLVGTSCARCAILAGRWYRYNEGFLRHPGCDCVQRPAREASDGTGYDVREAIAAGRVRGISDADRRAILEFGADPSQVINAKRGVYLAGGRSYTRTGTTRRGVAGARILARDADRAAGGIEAVASKTYRNLTFSRAEAAQYAELLRQGQTFTGSTRSGRAQTYAYRHARTPRPTPETILAGAPSRDDAIRELINFGYLI